MLTIAYDNDTSEWTLMYIDFETETPVAGSTFYYRVVQRDFYAGNKDENTVTLIASNDLDRQSLYVGGVGIDITNDRVSLKPAQEYIIGGVMPDNVTTTVDENGILSGQYYGGYGINVEDNKISTKTFVGTQAEWDALPNSTKNYYTSVNITDDHTQVSDDIPGHVIYDEDNNEQLQRGKLKFIDFTITDDSTNDMTVVEHNPYVAGDKIEIDDHTINCDDTVKSTFVGTREEWQSLTTEQKAKYEIVNLTNDLASGGTVVVDEIVRGNMNAVTSNAVARQSSWNLIAKDSHTITDGNFTKEKTVSTDFTKYNELLLISWHLDSTSEYSFVTYSGSRTVFLPMIEKRTYIVDEQEYIISALSCQVFCDEPAVGEKNISTYGYVRAILEFSPQKTIELLIDGRTIDETIGYELYGR
jgi:hypothetical protein